MGDAAGQCPQGLHFLTLAELLLYSDFLRYVPVDDDIIHQVPGLIPGPVR